MVDVVLLFNDTNLNSPGSVRLILRDLVPLRATVQLTATDSGQLFFKTSATVQLTATDEGQLSFITLLEVTVELTATDSGQLNVPIYFFPPQINYTCRLTGDGDNTTDIYLPITSASARLASGEQSYLSVVVPNGTAYIEAIEARQNGEIVIFQKETRPGETKELEIVRVNFDTIRVDQGPFSASLTLTGYKQRTHTPAPSPIALGKVMYRNSTGGQKTWRLAIDPAINPTDTVEYDSEQLVIERITYAITPTQVFMDLVS